MREDRIGLETLKLLVSVAWADHEIAAEEAERLLFLVEQIGAPQADKDYLRLALQDEGRLPAPDLRLLREHRKQVLDNVDNLIAIDNRIVTDEIAVRHAIEHMLASDS